MKEILIHLYNMSITTKVPCEILFGNTGGQAVQPYTCCRHTFAKTKLKERKIHIKSTNVLCNL